MSPSDNDPVNPPDASPAPRSPGASAKATELVAAATQDLADRIGVPVDQITVTRNDAVTWPDGSLGCPAPGMAYISMLSPGQLIVLRAGGKSYEYHAGRRVAPFLCEDPKPPLPAH